MDSFWWCEALSNIWYWLSSPISSVPPLSWDIFLAVQIVGFMAELASIFLFLKTERIPRHLKQFRIRDEGSMWAPAQCLHVGCVDLLIAYGALISVFRGLPLFLANVWLFGIFVEHLWQTTQMNAAQCDSWKPHLDTGDGQFTFTIPHY